jgi:hypothetical protein
VCRADALHEGSPTELARELGTYALHDAFVMERLWIAARVWLARAPDRAHAVAEVGRLLVLVTEFTGSPAQYGTACDAAIHCLQVTEPPLLWQVPQVQVQLHELPHDVAARLLRAHEAHAQRARSGCEDGRARCFHSARLLTCLLRGAGVAALRTHHGADVARVASTCWHDLSLWRVNDHANWWHQKWWWGEHHPAMPGVLSPSTDMLAVLLALDASDPDCVASDAASITAVEGSEFVAAFLPLRERATPVLCSDAFRAVLRSLYAVPAPHLVPAWLREVLEQRVGAQYSIVVWQGGTT